MSGQWQDPTVYTQTDFVFQDSARISFYAETSIVLKTFSSLAKMRPVLM